jgi:hypothetical protein
LGNRSRAAGKFCPFLSGSFLHFGVESAGSTCPSSSFFYRWDGYKRSLTGGLNNSTIHPVFLMRFKIRCNCKHYFLSLFIQSVCQLCFSMSTAWL